jgi:methylphosphotriester-DNA--protein-cysteine methyltransferase
MFGQKVRRIQPSDLGDRSRLPHCGNLAVTPLQPGLFSAEIINIGLGDMMLQIGRSTSAVVLGTLDPRTAWLMLPGNGAGFLVFNGEQAHRQDIAVYGAGAEYEIVHLGRASWATVMFSASAVERLVFPPAGSVILRSGASAMLCSRWDARRAADDLVDAARVVVGQDQAVFGVVAARLDLRTALMDMSHELLEGAFPAHRPLSEANGFVVARTIVRAATARISADPLAASDIGGLARSLDLTSSALDAAFRLITTVDAEIFIRSRRLSMLRDALLTESSRWNSVAQIAHEHGYLQPDAFADAYEQMFGETAATTLQRQQPPTHQRG